MSLAGDTVSSRNAALDGLRAFAITLIVASHCSFLKQGGVGNAIFFCLSGFLAAYPFSLNNEEERFASFGKIGQYYWNRILRIIPTFWVVLFFLRFTCGLLFFNTNASFFKNMFFIESFGHLWFLQQEMVMYLVFPFIMLLMLLLKRISDKRSGSKVAYYILCAAVLGILCIFARKYLTVKVFSLNGNGKPRAFQIGLFLVGMATAYLYKAYCASKSSFFRRRLCRITGDIVVFALLLGCIFSSGSFLKYINPSLEGYQIGWAHPVFCTILAGTAVFLLLTNPEGLAARFLGCKMFSAIGRISFGIYLIHFFLISFTSAAVYSSNFDKFLLVYILSIGIAWELHVFVEKPSGIFAKSKRFKDVINYYKAL